MASFDLEAPALTTPVLRAEGMPTLALEVQGNYASGSVTLEEAALVVGEGRMAVTGALGAEIDASVTASVVPLWIMGAVLSDLELQGTFSGSASAQGPPSALRAQFDLQATWVSAAPLAAAGLSPAEATVAGSYGDGALVLQIARIATAEGLSELRGRVANQLDLTLSLENFPAAIANALRPGLGLAGVLSGTLHATGPAEDPILSFDLRGAGIRGEPLRTVPVP